MKIIPFDIKLRNQIQSEENRYKGRYKVQTKDGIPVRIICWDKKDTKFPIITLAEDSSHSYEAIYTFRSDGKYNPNGVESGADLYLMDTWEPKFKVGDIIRHKNSCDIVHKIVKLNDTYYSTIDPSAPNLYNHNSLYTLPYRAQDFYVLVSEESKLTEFEKELADCLYQSIDVASVNGMENLAKKFAPKLLELAKKEIIEKLKEE